MYIVLNTPKVLIQGDVSVTLEFMEALKVVDKLLKAKN